MHRTLFCALVLVIGFGWQLPADEGERLGDGREGSGPVPLETFYNDAHRLVFFAVLEGCYNEGLLDMDLDLIVPKLDDGRRDTMANFVVSCPLCEPAQDAFVLYGERQFLSRQPTKAAQYRTFGIGLTKAVQAELAKPGKPCRDAIQGLIFKWVDERMKRMRFTAGEEKVMREKLAEMRDFGEQALKRFQAAENGEYLREHYKDWKSCPICSGASPMGDTAIKTEEEAEK